MKIKTKELTKTSKHNFLKNKGGKLPLVGVALIIFLLTVAVYFVADYVAGSYQDEDQLSGWDYTYTEKTADAPEGQMRIFNAQNPLLTEHAVRKSVLYLTRTIKPEETGKSLVLNTDYSPVKIRINGKDVYDNQFEKEEYVGNCYNAIYLEPSTHEQQIEIFMKLPFSVKFDARLKKGADSEFSFPLGFYFGGGIFIAGILAAVIFAIISIVKRRLYRSIIVAGLGAYVGLAIMMHLLPESTYKLNLPIWLRISEIVVQMTFILTLLCLSGLFRHHRRPQVFIGLTAGVSILFVMLSSTPLMVKISAFVISALCLLAVIIAAQHALAQLERRTQYATPVFVMCVFYALMIFFAGILLISRLRVLYIYTVAISTMVVGSVLEYTYIHDHRFAMKNREIKEQSVRYGNSVESIAVFIRNILSCTDQSLFYQAAITELLKILTDFDSANSNVIYSVAVKENDSYTEVICNGVEGCRYPVIEKNYLKNHKNCLFSETYFEYILKNGDDIAGIIHIENISSGLNAFFISMIEAAYCGLETAYENLFIQSARRDINIIFEELAENAEIDNGCSVEHLENICKYTRALCLRLGFDEEKAEHIAVASKLHDLGKIAVPKYIIEKKDRLNEEERIIVSSHTEFGYTILSAYDNDPLIATAVLIARYHHERYNGSGNNGLKGEEIPIEARIVTVCDVYDALVTERTYKSAWSKEDAMTYLADNAGKIFDPRICKEFLKYLKEEGNA